MRAWWSAVSSIKQPSSPWRDPPQGSFQRITPSWSVSSVVWLRVEHGLKEWHVWWDSVSCVSPQSRADVEGCSASDRQDCKDPQPHGARVERQRRGIPRSPQVPSNQPAPSRYSGRLILPPTKAKAIKSTSCASLIFMGCWKPTFAGGFP